MFWPRVHGTVMQVRHALTWHFPVYLSMISHFFFHVLHDSESTEREALAATARGLRLRWIALKKTAITLLTNVSTVLRADYLPLALTCRCTRNTVPLPLTSR